ncbi:L-arabinose ABC transporter ATP-binding protein AraG [Collimonas antrihumi]|uniref:L-arabinose ABC transporter ATP-binding protein AraG n=1 Tax=Collimonas antrihumi TaxID=1940615 RepID=UPI001B8D6EB3
MSTYLQFLSISKQFPGVKALDGVSFEAAEGQVHGLMGENGAGKSTLLKILGGQYIPSSGQILIGGQEQHFRSASDSIAAGVAIIHQELQYVPDMSVADNLMLGHFISKFGYLRESAALELVRSELERMGVDIDPRAKLRDLSIAQRQMVEICKALMRDAKIIALDEPTSSLSNRETEILFRMVDDLKRKNKALIYISHRLDEIYRLCDSCTVFRDGRKVVSYPSLSQVSQHELINQMVGREIADIYDYQPRPLGPVVLKVENMQGKSVPQPLSFEVRQGEIVGFFGLVGAGRSELMKLVYGAETMHTGKIFLGDKELQGVGIQNSIANGIVFCPEDRKEEGIVGGRSVSENINMSVRRHDRKFRFFVDDKKEAATADRFIKLLKIKTPNRSQEIRFLSGGNQQKAILSRWLAEPNVKVIIMDEPTRGIDVGAKHEIYAVMYELARKGCGIVMVSSELPEVLGVSDRIVVMCQGQIVGEVSHEDANENKVLAMALPKSATASITGN